MSSRGIPVFKRLAFRIGLSTAVLMGAVFAGTGIRLVQSEREQLTREVTRRVLAETRSLSMPASGPLLRKDPELGLHPLILRALEELPHLSDVVVLDRTLPGTAGDDVFSEMRRIRPDSRIVLMSGYAEDAGSGPGTERAAGFLRKPFTHEALAREVRRALEERGAAPPNPGRRTSARTLGEV